jgi:hypothetical protein
MANPELTRAPSAFDEKAKALVRKLAPTSGQRISATRKLARGLGWFSIGLGLVELLATRRLARMVGLRGRESLVWAYGLREVASGVGILASASPKGQAAGVWSRVGGDVVDLATLGAAASRPNPPDARPVAAIVAVAGVAALDLACARTLDLEAQAAEATTDYSDRIGMPSSPEQMRGAALDTFVQPRDMRVSPEVREGALH